MKHYYLSFFIATLMSMACNMASAHDIAVANSNGKTIYYNYNSDGSSVSVTYQGTSYSSYSNEYTGDVVIPETVTFGGKTYSVTSIRDYAFYRCSGLTSVTIPNSVTNIGTYAFRFCRGLTSVTISNSVTSIGIRTFSDCSSLTSVTIPNSVTSIGVLTFSDCSSLTSVTIPNSVTSIDSGAFDGCSGLTGIKVANGNSVYDSRNDCNAIIETASNTIIIGCKTTIIPNSVTKIGSSAFSGCSGLTSITIPNSVTQIGGSAFYGCSGLTSVTIPNSVTSIGSYAFRGCSGLTGIKVAYGNSVYDSRNDCNAIIETASNTLVAGCKNTIIPNSVTSISSSAFYGCSDLTSVIIPNSVTSIGNQAFYGTAWFDNQPDGLVYAGNVAYRYKGTMAANTSIILKEGTVGISPSAFYGCSDLTSVTIPASVTSIGNQAFDGTAWFDNQPDGLVYAGNVAYRYKGTMPANTSIILKEGTVGISPSAFSDCSGLTSVTISNSVTSIGDWAFYGCGGLTSVTIGNGVTSIGSSAFYNCSDLTSIIVQAEIPSSYSLIEINTNATLYVPAKAIETYRTTSPWSNFTNIQAIEGTDTVCGTCGENLTWIYDKTTKTMTISGTGEMTEYVGYNDVPWNEITDSIKVVNINEGVTSIGYCAFFKCNNMVYISIPNTIESIGTGAFMYCSNLSGIELPEKLSSIERFTFWGCDSLKSILIPDNITTIKEYAFVGCSSLKSIEIGKSVNNIENYAFGRNGSFTLRVPNGIASGVLCPVSKSLNKIIWKAKEYKASCNAFALCSNQITDFQFGDEVTVIPPGLCNGMSNLKTISIPSSVVNIGSMAFYGCTGLKSVLIPDGVAYIGDSAFGNCRRLASVNIPSTLTEIEPGTFNGCINLSAINIPNNVTSIGNSAFAECDSLISVVVPSSVTNVGSYAFGGCSQLRLLQFVSTMPIQLTAEIGITCQTKYVVPEESLDDYKKAWLEYYRPDVYTYLPIPSGGVMFTEKATLDNYTAAMQNIDKSTITSVCFYDSIDASLTVEKIQEGMNPNCLYYYYSDNGLQGKNLVNLDGYSSEKIILSDANVFRCLIPFTAKKALFTYTPSIWANGFGGWETLCLPFEVSAFKASESGYISPILLGAYGDFWLRQFVGASSKALYFSSTLDGTMKANTPYLLAFPGTVMGSGHLQGQTITFLGKNVEFEANATAEVQRNDKVFVGNYDNVADDASGWILNSTGSDLIASSVVGDKPFRFLC